MYRFYRSPGRHLRFSQCVSVIVVFLFLLGVVVCHPTNFPVDDFDLSGIAGPYSFNRFCRLSSEELWAVGGNGSVQYTSVKGTIERQITDVSLNGVYFTNSSAGWVVGNNGTILHTSDQGVNWQIQRSGVNEDLYGVTCHDENRCWAVGRKGLILRTIDQGDHWKVLKSGTAAILFAVNFVNARSGWAVGEDGFIVHTDDSGETWEKQRATIVLFPKGPFAAATDLLAVKFLDETRGWVAGASGIARTQDGGRTWTSKEIEDNAFIGLVSNDGKTVWAISSEGMNYLTKDGGLTWAPADSGKVAKRQAAR